MRKNHHPNIPPLRAYSDGYDNMGDSSSHRSRRYYSGHRLRTLKDFLEYVGNPEEVEIWFRVYKFNTILHFCCGHMFAPSLWTYRRDDLNRQTIAPEAISGKTDFRVLFVDEEEFLAAMVNALFPLEMPRDLLKIIWEYYFDVLDGKLICLRSCRFSGFS